MLKAFLKKLEYRFLVEITIFENALFSYKVALSKANFKTNIIRSTKWTYHKKTGFFP